MPSLFWSVSTAICSQSKFSNEIKDYEMINYHFSRGWRRASCWGRKWGKMWEGFPRPWPQSWPWAECSLMRPDTRSTRQSPKRDLAVMYLLHTLIYYHACGQTSLTRMLRAIFNHANPDARLWNDYPSVAPTHHSLRGPCDHSGHPHATIILRWQVLTGLQPAHKQPNSGRRVTLFSFPTSLLSHPLTPDYFRPHS